MGLFARAIIVAVAMTIVRSAHPLGFAPWQPPAGANLPVLGYTVVRAYPHDRDAFTQGLQYLDGFLYEGTGLNGRSSIRKVKLETGEVLQRRDVPAQYFGEGIVVWQSELFQLTWQSGVAFIYDAPPSHPRRRSSTPAKAGASPTTAPALIMSDGTDESPLPRPGDVRRAAARQSHGRRRGRCAHLNELEYVKGEIFANVWQTDYVARIDPKRAASPAGSTFAACCRRATGPRPTSSTGSRTMRPATGCSSPASSGPGCSRSSS